MGGGGSVNGQSFWTGGTPLLGQVGTPPSVQKPVNVPGWGQLTNEWGKKYGWGKLPETPGQMPGSVSPGVEGGAMMDAIRRLFG